MKLSGWIACPASVTRQKHLSILLLRMTVIDLKPFSTVDDHGFRQFVHGLDPSYIIPSRTTLGHHLPAAYDDAATRMKDKLRAVNVVYQITSGQHGVLTTVQPCYNAAGDYIPPMVKKHLALLSDN